MPLIDVFSQIGNMIGFKSRPWEFCWERVGSEFGPGQLTADEEEKVERTKQESHLEIIDIFSDITKRIDFFSLGIQSKFFSEELSSNYVHEIVIFKILLTLL